MTRKSQRAGRASVRPRTPEPRSKTASRARPRGLSLHASPQISNAESRWLHRAAWAVLAALAVALLAVALGPHRVGDNFTETDFYGAYAEGARAIQRGIVDPSRYSVVGPGYEVALALAGLPIRDLLLAAELLSIAAVVMGLWLWHRLLARRADPRLALAAVVFMAVNPTLFRFGYSATTDALAFALQALALHALLTGVGTRAALGAGLAVALAFLTRYNAIVLVPAGLAMLLWGGTPQTRRGRSALWFTVGFAALVVPWVVLSLARGGALGFQLHHNIAYDVFARSQGIPWDEYQRKLQPEFKTLWDVIARDPGAVARRELFNVWDHLHRDLSALLGWPVAACALVGGLLAWSDGTLRRLWPLWLAGGLSFLILVPAFYSERYSLALLPVYATLAGAAFSSPRLAMVSERGPRIWLKALLISIPIGLSLSTLVKNQRFLFSQLPTEVLECAETLRAMKRPGDRVIARKPHIAYHAGVTATPFPFARDLPELGDYARERGVRWLFFAYPEAELRPRFWYLLDTTGAVPGLTVRHATPGHPAVLYEIGPEFGAEPVWFANDTLRSMHIARARIMVFPHDREALYLLGLIERMRENWAQARQYLSTAARFHPRDLRVLLLLGEVCLNQQDAAASREAYQRAESVSPGNVDVRLGLGWVGVISGNPQEAASWWRPVLGRTRDPATLQQMIEIFRAVGDREAESQAFDQLSRVAAGR